jgi:hypothetical protein
MINSFSRFFNGLAIQPFGLSAPVSTSWPSANLALYMPFALPFPYPVRRLFAGNGSAAGGNISLGIYSSDGQGIYVSGGVASSGNDQLQYVTPATEFILSPGRYFFGMSRDSNTTNRTASGGISSQHVAKIMGMLQQATAYPLPSAATFAVISGITAWPFVGITRTASGF